MAARAIITGIGLVTPLGCTLESCWEALLEGAEVLQEARGFSTVGLPWRRAGEILDEQVSPLLPARKFVRLPRHDQFIAAAVQQCFLDWGADRSLRSCDLSRIGLFLGTSRGPLDCVADISLDIASGREREVDPLKFQQTVLNAPLGHLSLHYRITGPCITFSNGNISGLTALGAALSALERGEVNLAIVGGGDALTVDYYQALGDLGVLSPAHGPEQAAPFGRDRNGIMLSEGAAFVAVELPETSRRRKGKEYATVESIAMTCDAWSPYGNEPQGAGYAAAVEQALEQAGLRKEEVDAILASASGDRWQDRAEYLGLRRVWGEKLKDLPTLALKGQTGDMGAAWSMVAIALAAEIFRTGKLPGTKGALPLDPEFDLSISDTVIEAQCSRILIDEVAWGGLNAALILSAPSGSASAGECV